MKTPRLLLLGLVAVILGLSIWWYADPVRVSSSEDGPASGQTLTRPDVGTEVDTGSTAAPKGARDARVDLSRTAETDPADRLRAALAEPNRFERQHSLERLGYNLAVFGAASASQTLAKITRPADRAAFIRGMFSKLGEGNPSDALAAVKTLASPNDRESAISGLVEQWETEQPERESPWLPEFESAAGRLLGRLAGNPELAVQAARELLKGKDRVLLLTLAATAEVGRAPQVAFNFGAELQGEERQQFQNAVARSWARSEGEAAFSWAAQEPDPTHRSRLQLEVMTGWASQNPQAAARRLADIPDSATRDQALHVIGSYWGTADTQAALSWAHGIPDPAAREAAIASIQGSAPVGIGVALTADPNGFPTIRELVPGGPASTSGVVKPGYKIAAIGDGRGGFTPVKDLPLGEVTKLIRGKPGTAAVLQVIPEEGRAASPVTVTIPRQQLLFKKPPTELRP